MSDPTRKLLITLTPTDYYFFGGEETFDDSGGVRNYLVRSNRLPQQTALVGILRHVLFYQNKHGIASFDAGSPIVQDYGALHGISPLFLQYGDGENREFFLPASAMTLADKQEIQVDVDHLTGKGFAGNDFVRSPKLTFQKDGKIENYTYKEELEEFWVSANSGTKLPAKFKWKNEGDPKTGEDNNGIFISALHIGIDKMNRMKPRTNAEKDAKPDDEAFYKQEFLRLREGFRFAVVAEIDESVPVETFSTPMPFGGENRTFVLEAAEWTPDLQRKIQPEKAYGRHSDRIVLTSDAWVENPGDLFGLCRLVVAESVPFRSIATPAAVYGADEKAKNKALSNLHLGKSETLRHLLKRGSVLFPKKGYETQITDLVKAPENFRNIGYNHFYAPNHPFSI